MAQNRFLAGSPPVIAPKAAANAPQALARPCRRSRFGPGECFKTRFASNTAKGDKPLESASVRIGLLGDVSRRKRKLRVIAPVGADRRFATALRGNGSFQLPQLQELKFRGKEAF